MKSLYYQFVNWVQAIPAIWFYTIFLCGMGGVLMLIIKFYKKYDGSQTRVEKLSIFIVAMMLFAVIAYITHLWH